MKITSINPATGEALVIDDGYLLPGDVTYKQNRSFDEKFGYRTKSMLVLPMPRAG